MFFSSILFRTFSNVLITALLFFSKVFLSMVLFSLSSQAGETGSGFQLVNSPDGASADSSSDSSIDWSKPVVSRGFGLEKSQGNSDEDALTQYQSGQVFYFFGEYDKAIEKWLPLLDRNFPEAQASMGWLYQGGVGVEKNEKKAFELYEKAALQDNAIAQNNLGVMYENGLSVKPDLDQARHWYKRSAEQGYRFGQYNYANILLLHKSKKSDFEKAKIFLKKSADQGVKQANEKLASID